MEEKPKYYRCVTCGRLLGVISIQKGICVGHKLRYATDGNFIEFIKIKLDIVDYTVWEWLKLKMGCKNG